MYLFITLVLVIYTSVAQNSRAISLGRVLVPSPKIVINLPGTYVKLPCKGEPDRFSGYRDPSVKTNKQTNKHPDKHRSTLY